MAWVRLSDTAGNHPIVLEPLTDPTEPPAMDCYLWANALAGVVLRAATAAAGYNRSYVVSDATVASVAGPAWRAVAEAAERAGYWTRHERGWLLIDDPNHLLHIRTGEEIDWEKARKADAANPKLTAPVRLRDGDGCRYCGVIVRWGDSRSSRGGTYDHRVPGQQAQTPDDLRVACRGCNGLRGNDPSADTDLPPRPAPAVPFYGPETAAFLADRGYTVPVTAREPQRPGTQPDPARRDPAIGRTPLPRDPAASGTPLDQPRDPAPSRTPLPSETPHTIEHTSTKSASSANSAERRATESRSPGRDGRGQDTGRDGNRRTPHVPARRSRGRKGRPKH